MIIDKEYIKTSKPNLKVSLVELTDDKQAYVRALLSSEYDVCEDYAVSEDSKGERKWSNSKFKKAMVTVSLCNADGERLIEENDFSIVGNVFKEADILLLFMECNRLNNLDTTVDKLVGNLSQTQEDIDLTS